MIENKKHIIYVSGMLCSCCIRLVELLLKTSQIPYDKIEQGKIVLPDATHTDEVIEIIKKNGFQLIKDKEQILVEQIKVAVIELVHYANNSNSIIRNSDYLVDKLDVPYQNLTTIFSRYENQTLEKYIIKHKIEKTKELLDQSDFTLSEIAYQMGYSSVQYLSTQFKKLTGVTVSEYKQTGFPSKIPFDQI